MSEVLLMYPQMEILNRVFEIVELPKRKRNLHWESDLVECDIEPYRVVPLVSSKQLREEGRIMKHCVGVYDDSCHRGLSRVFSVRDSVARRIATVSLVWQDDYWQLEQVKGPSNAEVLHTTRGNCECESMTESLELTDLYFVSQEILQRYRVAWGEKFERYVCGIIKPNKLS